MKHKREPKTEPNRCKQRRQTATPTAAIMHIYRWYAWSKPESYSYLFLFAVEREKKKLLHFANCKRFKDRSPRRFGSSSLFLFGFFYFYYYYSTLCYFYFIFISTAVFSSLSLSSPFSCCALPSANMKSL